MYRLISLLSILIFLSGCSIGYIVEDKKEKSSSQESQEIVDSISTKVHSDRWMEERIKKRWYEGHEYLILSSKDSRRVTGVDCNGFVHSPNCPCLNNE